MASGHQSNAEKGQHEFFAPMRYEERRRHEDQAKARNYKGSKTPMLHRAPADREAGKDECESKADLVNGRLKQEMRTHAEHRDKNDGRDTVQRAQARNANADLVEALAGRLES